MATIDASDDQPHLLRLGVAARSRRPRSEWAVSPSWSVEPCSCAGCAGCGVAHSAGPFSQEWAVTSRRTHGPPEDLLDDWGQLRVPVVFPPESDIDGLERDLVGSRAVRLLSPDDKRVGYQIVQTAFAACERDHQKADTKKQGGEELREVTSESSPEGNSVAVRVGDGQTTELLANGSLPRRALQDWEVEEQSCQDGKGSDRSSDHPHHRDWDRRDNPVDHPGDQPNPKPGRCPRGRFGRSARANQARRRRQ
jgi:hypothetical protein